MARRNTNIRLLKLPSDMELVLYMIREELKSTKFFNVLRKASLHDCFYQSHFDSVILAYMGFPEVSDEFFAFYSELIDKYSEKIEEDNAMITECAMEVYEKIRMEKKRLCGDE